MSWPLIIDDDGSGETGTTLDKALFDQIKAYVDAPPPGTSIAIGNAGSNVFDVVLPTPQSFYYVSVNAGLADITIRSITAGRVGDLVLIENVSVNAVYLTYWYGAGQPTSLYHRVTSGPTPIGSGGSALYVWEGVWRLAQHDQGKAIRIPYSAANYTADGGGTWTVAAGNVQEHSYYLAGNLLTLHLNVRDATIAGTVVNLFVAGWPFTTKNIYPIMPALAGGAWVQAIGLQNQAKLQIQKLDASAFATGLHYLNIHTTLEVN